jgi:hypothetical protein
VPLNSVVADKVRPDDHGSLDWEPKLSARSRASSLLDKPTGKDTTHGDITGELNRGAWTKGMLSSLTGSARSRCEFIWEPVSSPAAPICVWLNGVTGIDQFGAVTVTNEEPMDWRLRLRLPWFRTIKVMAPIASKAATPPMAHPAITTVGIFDCDFDEVPVVMGLTVIWKTGALRSGRSDIEKRACYQRT